MQIRSIRRIVADGNHNAFTGAQCFRDAIYVAYRQGDGHVCEQGKLVVLRSRDSGHRFDHVHVARGAGDTRDAHLYTVDDRRLHLVGFEALKGKGEEVELHSGTSWTDNGLNWSPWTRYEGTTDYVMWRPRFFRGTHYCAGYRVNSTGGGEVAWFESTDGLRWSRRRVLREGTDQPSECFPDFKPDGTCVMIVRRDNADHRPLLMTAPPPYDKWETIELDVRLSGPALWLTDERIWISGRWFAAPGVAHVGVFEVVNGMPELRVVLPSGPGFDCSYMGVARDTLNKRRCFLSYYSGHTASDDPGVEQFNHPDIYLAEALFDAPFITQWRTAGIAGGTLATASYADPDAAPKMGWRELSANPPGKPRSEGEGGFADVRQVHGGKQALVYLCSDLQVGPTDRGSLFFGYDGPIRVWLNGTQVFEGPGDNPATRDKTELPVAFKHGVNRLVIALDTHGGKAWGVYARFERAE